MSRCLLFAALLCGAQPLRAQDAPAATLPFGVGERLEYRVALSLFGEVGRGVMRVGADSTRPALWVLRFEMDAGRGPFRATDRTASWLDPIRFAVLRFEKDERHPLSESRERVVIDTVTRTFTDSGQAPAALGSALPMDELSFLYLLRTLDVPAGAELRLERHFDPARNPTLVRGRGLDTLETPLGRIAVRLVEMEVRDPKRYRGTGVIRLALTDDACRVPVRIESRMPVLGTTTLTLAAWTRAPGTACAGSGNP